MPKLEDAHSGWFCFQAQPKKEHLAASLIRRDLGLETYCPRISQIKRTKRGKVRYVDALFPCYIFVAGDIAENYRKIQSIQGIRRLLIYGNIVPRIPDHFIEDIKSMIDNDNGIKELEEDLPKAGDMVTIGDGAFKNLEVLVTQSMPSQNRVAILLDILGRELEIEVNPDHLICAGSSAKFWDRKK